MQDGPGIHLYLEVLEIDRAVSRSIVLATSLDMVWTWDSWRLLQAYRSVKILLVALPQLSLSSWRPGLDAEERGPDQGPVIFYV